MFISQFLSESFSLSLQFDSLSLVEILSYVLSFSMIVLDCGFLLESFLLSLELDLFSLVELLSSVLYLCFCVKFFWISASKSWLNLSFFAISSLLDNIFGFLGLGFLWRVVVSPDGKTDWYFLERQQKVWLIQFWYWLVLNHRLDFQAQFDWIRWMILHC